MSDTTGTPAPSDVEVVFDYDALDGPFRVLGFPEDGTFSFETAWERLPVDSDVARALVHQLGGAVGPEHDYENDGVRIWELHGGGYLHLDATSAIHPPTAVLNDREHTRGVPGMLRRRAMQLLAAASYAEHADRRRVERRP